MAVLSASLNADHRWHPAEFRQRAYLINGWEGLKVWDGRTGSLNDAGIVGPSVELDSWTPAPSTAAGNVTGGVHVVRYRYKDSKTGYVSNPSEERELTAAGALNWTFPIDTSGAVNIIRSADAKVDTIVLEMTVASGGEFFVAAETLQTAASIVVDLTDVTLAQKFLPWPEDGHDLAPVMKYVASHRGFLWAFGRVVHAVGTVAVTAASTTVTGTLSNWTEDALGASGVPPTAGRRFIRVGMDEAYYEISHFVSATSLVLVEPYAGLTNGASSYEIFTLNNNVYVSRPDYPESFPPLSFLAAPEGELSGEIRAGVPYHDTMIFLTRHSAYKLVWADDPATDGTRRPINGDRGAITQRVVVAHDARIFSLDRQGFWYFEGVAPHDITPPVEELLEDVNWSVEETFHAVYLPRLKAIRWYVATGVDTAPKFYFQLELRNLTWSTGRLDAAVTESRLVKTIDGLQVFLGDENGHVWIGDKGTTEGATPDSSHLTAATGSSVGTILTEETLPTGGVGIAGAFAYWVEGREARLIDSNTANSLTLATAFTTAPAAGHTIWVGRILGKLKTKAFAAPRGHTNKRHGRYVQIEFEPLSSPRYALVRLYEDYSATAKTYASPRGGNRGYVLPGKDPNYDATDYLVELQADEGQVRIPIGDQASRHLEAEIEVIEPDTPLEITSIFVGSFEAEAAS